MHLREYIKMVMMFVQVIQTLAQRWWYLLLVDIKTNLVFRRSLTLVRSCESSALSAFIDKSIFTQDDGTGSLTAVCRPYYARIRHTYILVVGVQPPI